MSHLDPDFVLSGQKLSQIFFKTLKEIKPGKKLSEVNRVAEELIVQSGGKAGFKTVRDYQWACCLNLNEGVVHGIPDEKRIKEGDLVSLDMGLWYRDWHTDMAYTITAGQPLSSVWKNLFLKTGRIALKKAVKKARAGGQVKDISRAIEKTIKKAGFWPVETLTGHGIGKRLHQPPFIPCVVRGSEEENFLLKAGQALAIEVIYLKEKSSLVTDSDGWTIKARSGKIAGLFEETIFIKGSRVQVLTPFFWEKNVQD